jgi:hypothetical protein
VDALVEKHLSGHRPDLRALVADDRTVKSDLLRPRQCAGKWAPGARDDFDSRLLDPADRFHIARVQLQRRAEDGPIEIEGQQSIRSAGGYLFTSGFKRLGGRPPRTAVAMLRAAIADISDRVRTVALDM